MKYDALFFDMDGTLVQSSSLMPRAFQEAFADCGMEIQIEPWRGSGCTDYEVMDIFLSDFSLTDEEKSTLKEKIAASVRTKVVSRLQQQGLKAVPGAAELIKELVSLGIHPGLLTGNLEAIVAPKLAEAGMSREDFSYGGFGDHCAHRPDTARKALASASAYFGHEVQPSRALIIGDTPNDIACARAVGADVLAVCTGKHTKEQLEVHKPDYLLSDLTDSRCFLEIIGFTPKA